jgi:hypothetical protein
MMSLILLVVDRGRIPSAKWINEFRAWLRSCSSRMLDRNAQYFQKKEIEDSEFAVEEFLPEGNT